MSRRAALLVAAALACGGTRAGTSPLPTGTPFRLRPESGYGIQGTFEGSIAMGDRWVYVTAPKGGIKTYQLDRQDYWDLRLRAAVATCQGRSFEIVSEGRAARLAPLLGLSPDAAFLDTTTRTLKDTLRLDVGVPAGVDLARSWVALIFEWPVQSAMAIYTVHTNVPLLERAAPWSGRQAELPGERCR